MVWELHTHKHTPCNEPTYLAHKHVHGDLRPHLFQYSTKKLIEIAIRVILQKQYYNIIFRRTHMRLRF